MKKLGFGCMRLPQNSDKSSDIDFEQTCKMVDLFIENGFTYFDTAYMYHDYKSETVMREALVKRHKRDEFTIATKLPTPYLKQESDCERIFNEQLEKLGVEYFDYYLIHCLNTNLFGLAKKCKAFEFVKKQKELGKVIQMGFSFHDTAEVLDKILSEYNDYVDFVQLQINYLDWDSESIQSRLCYEVACKYNKKVVVMEPVKGGKLAILPAKAASIFDKLDSNLSYPSYAIRFAASLDNVFMVLSGMSNIAQLLDNMSYMKDFKPLDDNEIKACMDVAQVLKNMAIGCTNCKYCIEGCPKNIKINEIFNLYNTYKEEAKSLDEAKKLYAKFDNLASSCIKCGKCEKICPQHLKIRNYLEDITKTFEE